MFYCGSGTLSVRALGDPKLGDPSECQPTLERSRSNMLMPKAKIKEQYSAPTVEQEYSDSHHMFQV